MMPAWPLLLALSLPVAVQPLASLRDRHRVLLLFAPSALDARVRAQLAELDGAAMAERDLLLMPELEAWPQSDPPPELHQSPTNAAAEQAALRHRFHIAPGGFTVLLVGKDGGEKFRADTPITAARLNGLIDAMPMRQEEMRRPRR